MRSSLILGITLLLTIAALSIVQARKPEQTCGDLGSGMSILLYSAFSVSPLFRSRYLFNFSLFIR